MVSLKDKVILHLHNKGWKVTQIHNLSQLWSNFEFILLSLNRNVLSSSFSISEVNNIKHEIGKKLHTPFSTNRFLYGINGHSDIKIHLDDGNTVPLLVFNKFGKNLYQIAKDVKVPTSKGVKVIDTLLLINGLPMVQIGENNYGADPKDILTSIHNLQSTYITQNSFLSAIQIIIGMSSKDVRYMANNPIQYHFDVAFSFHWTKNNNRLPVKNWLEFSDILLSPISIQQMITRYIITDNVENKQSIKIMRPYQILSTQKIINKLKNYDFVHGDHKLGYVWHTTGSGKTISSFKTAWLAAQLPNINKVVYIVDRVALSNQTANKYKEYDPRNIKINKQLIIGTHSTGALKRALCESQTNIIVTSTQKLDSLMNNWGFSLTNRNIVFIVDEAHQGIGPTFLSIKKSFPRSAWVGYTGTPRFQAPSNGYTTEQVFGKPLDIYTIGEAVKDQNVLGFHVDFESTVPSNKLGKKYIPKCIHWLNPKLSLNKVNYKAEHLSLDDCKQFGRIIYDMNHKHVHLVVKDIMNNWPKRSNNYKYNALLTTHVNMNSSKKMAVMYFKEFLSQNRHSHHPLKVAITFSPDNTSLSHGHNEMNASLLWCMDKYDQMFGTHFSAQENFNGYKNDLISRLNKTNPTKQYLDLVIVVDQLLTGFDAPQLNTLYVDRILTGARLIQAYSRTNRIYNMQNKPFGNIITYRWPKHARIMMDKAFKVYANPKSAHIRPINDGTFNQIFSLSYNQLVKKLSKLIYSINAKTHGFKLLPKLVDEQESLYHALEHYNRLVTRIKQYDNYQGPKKLLEDIGLSSEQEYLLTVVLANKLKRSIAKKYHMAMDSLNLKMEYIGDIQVNSSYLYSIIASYINATHAANANNPKVKKLHYTVFHTLKKLNNQQYVSRLKNSIHRMSHAYQSDVSAHSVKHSIHTQRNNDVNKFEQYWGINNDKLDIKDFINNQNKQSLVHIINNGVQNYQDIANSKVRNNNPISYKIQLVYALKHLVSRNQEH